MSVAHLALDKVEEVSVVSKNDSRIIKIMKIKEKDEKIVVVNFPDLKCNHKNIKKLIRRIEYLQSVQNQSLLTIKGILLPNNSDEEEGISIFYEYPEHGCLSSVIDDISVDKDDSPINLKDSIKIIFGTCSAMETLHICNIVHGDLQPETVFLTAENKPKLINYGIRLANPAYKEIPDDSSTLSMLPPEMLNKEMSLLNENSDIYAYGILLYRIFVNTKEDDYLEKIKEGQPLEVPEYVLPQIKSIIEPCLRKNPSERKRFEEIKPKLKELITEISENMKKAKLNANIMKEAKSKNFLALIDTEFFQTTNEFQELENLEGVSKKAASIALRSRILQNAMLSIDGSNFDAILQWILKNYNFSVSDDLSSFTKNLINAANVRFTKIELYKNLLKRLLQSDTENKKFSMLRETYIITLFNLMTRNDPYPSFSSNMDLLRRLLNEGVYKKEEIVSAIKVLFGKRTQRKEFCFLPFTWFAPELKECQPKVYNKILELMKSSRDVYLMHKAFILFIDELPKLEENNWSLYYQRYNYTPNEDSLDAAIFNDDVGMLEKHLDECNDYMTKNQFATDHICDLITEDVPLIAYAAACGSFRVFQYLEEKGFNKGNHSLLKFAVAGGNLSIIANVEQTEDVCGDLLNTAIMYHQCSAFLSLLQSERVDIEKLSRQGKSPLVAAARANNIFALTKLIELRVSPQSKEPFNVTAIQAAAENGQIDALMFLLQCSTVNTNAHDSWGRTALHIAAEKNQFEAVCVLIASSRVNKNACDEKMKTPLHVAVENDSLDTIKLLIKLPSVDIYAKDKKGMTPLHMAVKSKEYAVISMFLGIEGIKLNVLDNKERTPYMIALEMGDESSLSLFENGGLVEESKSNQNCRI